MNKLLIIFISAYLLSACMPGREPGSEKILARVHNEYLYQKDLNNLIPKGAAPADSLSIARNYINNWVREKLVLHRALENLSSADMDFEQQIENYKNSLIIYKYETRLIGQKLDTSVNYTEIEEYYEANKENFQLNENIVKINFVKLHVDSPYVKEFRKLLHSDEGEKGDYLREFSSRHASDYFLQKDVWLYFNDFIEIVPISTYNQEAYLKDNRFVELKDSIFNYLIRIRDFKIKESVSPLVFEEERITDIIINKRKIKLIEEMRSEAYERALENSEFEIY